MPTNRKLDSMEQGMELFNRYAHSLNIVVVSKIRGSLDTSVIRQSLDLVQKRHPSLRSHIVGDINDLRFKVEGTERIPLQVIHNESEDWRVVVERELNQKIESEKVLARAILIHSDTEGLVTYFITTLHHAIADALSGINLHSNILEYCQEIINGSIPNINYIEALPSLEFLVNKTFQTPIEELISITNTSSISKLKSANQATHLERMCKLIHKKLDLDSSQRLIKKCKEKGVSVHGAICSAMMFSLAKEIQINNHFQYFSCRSSVDMRRRLDPQISSENLSMLVSALTSIHEFTHETTFWEVAKSVTEQIKERLKTSEIYTGVINYRKGAEYLLAHPEATPFSIFVTNIGKVNIPKIYGSLILEEISYALSITVMGSVFGVAVSTFSEEIIFNFIFSSPLIEQETINSLIENTIEFLKVLE